jgi:hypothetical protein
MQPFVPPTNDIDQDFSPALEDYLWQRLKVISVEDIGFGEPLAPALIQSLFEMTGACDRAVGERKLYAIHAVRYLRLCNKDRSPDEMINWINNASKSSKLLPTIPELEDRDLTYRNRIMGMLNSGELRD